MHSFNIIDIKCCASGIYVAWFPIQVPAIVVTMDLCTTELVTGMNDECCDHKILRAKFWPEMYGRCVRNTD